MFWTSQLSKWSISRISSHSNRFESRYLEEHSGCLPRIELGYSVPQTDALPLGYRHHVGDLMNILRYRRSTSAQYPFNSQVGAYPTISFETVPRQRIELCQRPYKSLSVIPFGPRGNTGLYALTGWPMFNYSDFSHAAQVFASLSRINSDST